MVNHHLAQMTQAIWAERFGEREPSGTLEDIANITSGKRPLYKQTEYSDNAKVPLIGASSIMGYTNAVLYDEKILVTGRVGTHGIIQRYSRPCWASDNTLVIKSEFYEFTYQQLCMVDFRNMNCGSTQPLITQTDLKNVPIFLPAGDELREFEKLAGAIMERYESNNLENESLATLRDTLLPRLMSGEISVTEAIAK